MASAVVAALAGVLGLAIGRFWDRRSESSRWQRDQGVRCYEDLVQAYYRVREMIRLLGSSEPGTKVKQSPLIALVKLVSSGRVVW